VDVDLAEDARALVHETVHLVRLHDRHLARTELALRLPVVDKGHTFEDDQQLDVGMAMQAWTPSRPGIHEQHARTDPAVVLTDELSRDDVLRQLVDSKNLDQRLDAPLS
jgi:hypothetical protein